MSNLNGNSWANVPSSIYKQLMNGNWTPYSPSPMEDEDVEDVDRKAIQEMIYKYLKDAYPEFDPEIVYGLDKEYFLPALKVLLEFRGNLFSPQEKSQWKEGELRARCNREGHLSFGSSYVYQEGAPIYHDAPDERCDCGIYGSVNMEELFGWLNFDHPPMSIPSPASVLNAYADGEEGKYLMSIDVILEHPRSVLCVVEPMPDAKVIVCRKGWKASHVFISEIVDETISIDQTSQLLSIAWKRNIDIRRLYENW